MTKPSGAVDIRHGEALDVLRGLPDNSVDAVVTDPPYGLEFMGKDWDSFKTYAGGNPNMKPQGVEIRATEDGEWQPGRAYGSRQKNPRCRRCGKLMRGNGACKCPEPQIDTRTAEGAFQFQAWCEEWATECLRILKPGGFILAFGGTRTVHRLACAIEDAGFEIRDRVRVETTNVELPAELGWLHGQGFPKSHAVDKAIDRMRHDREDVLRVTAWIRDRCAAVDATARTLDEACETNGMGGHWTSQGAQALIPTAEAWALLEPILGEPPEWMRPLIRPARLPGEAWGQREVIGRRTDGGGEWQRGGARERPEHGYRVRRHRTLEGGCRALAGIWHGAEARLRADHRGP